MKKLRCYFELTLLLVAHFMVPIQFRIDLSSNITLLIIVQDMKYLLGPVSSEADLRWCPDPRRTDYTRPLIDLAIDMRELRNVDGDITLCLGIYFSYIPISELHYIICNANFGEILDYFRENPLHFLIKWKADLS